ncbi:MAG: hypothetical protein KatS3mg052_0261 [Candidatus Roseilinea sp.]|nr:MAG: hypothetical protein KatS3mg052_0261 [Candidatus Roseilinea sp.]
MRQMPFAQVGDRQSPRQLRELRRPVLVADERQMHEGWKEQTPCSIGERMRRNRRARGCFTRPWAGAVVHAEVHQPQEGERRREADCGQHIFRRQTRPIQPGREREQTEHTVQRDIERDEAGDDPRPRRAPANGEIDQRADRRSGHHQHHRPLVAQQHDRDADGDERSGPVGMRDEPVNNRTEADGRQRAKRHQRLQRAGDIGPQQLE